MTTKTELLRGDRVAYSRAFLRSICCYTGPLPFARGTVTALHPLSQTVLATIDWDDQSIPETVNVANLVRVADLHKELV